ncbi:protein white isoform X3 [Nematostella vectensis]|uniref:protein white isoform X3 n=1 Tax=Nematostella vectensis TaxID=45351 RepID=UPI00207733C0|nr:protein white isoform X3 [Nematostella vectensis]
MKMGDIRVEDGTEEIPISGLSVVYVQQDSPPDLNNAAAINDGYSSTGDIVLPIKKGAEDFKRVTLEWQDINVTVPIKKGNICKRLCCRSGEDDGPRSKQILSNVTGKVSPGTLLAVMGASGAGKSTLINVLAHRNIGSMHVSGVVKANNKTLGLAINSISAYIQQEDLFREHLKFQALLRKDRHVPDKERMLKVEEVITELGLLKCADTVIGTPGRVRGISGGEQKRLSFASEILTGPSILFADEPTSGLDSFMAQSVVATLQKLAAQGRTIICTIHQPSSEVYNMFSSLLLIAEGRTAYFGATRDAIQHFSSLGYPCPPNYNPADYFVHTLAVVPDDRQNCLDRIKAICNAHDAQKIIHHDKCEDDSFAPEEKAISHKKYKASWCRQFRAVMWRSWLSNQREVLMFRIRIMQSIIIGLLCGLIYLDTDVKEIDGVSNIAGALFFMIVTLSFSSLQAVTFVFPNELPVFLRDHQNAMYRADVYFLCKTFAEVPIFILSPFLLCVIPYWMIGLRSEFTRFLICFLVLMLVTNAAVSLGYVISTMMRSTTGASAIAPPILIPFLLFGGFFVRADSTPVYFIWIAYLSFFKYGFELLSINQWEGYGTISDCVPLKNNTSPCLPNGEKVLEFFDVDKDMYAINFIALTVLLVGFRLLAFLLLLRRTSQRQ